MKQIHKHSELNEYINMLNPEEINDELIELFEEFRRNDERQRKSISRHLSDRSVQYAEENDLVSLPQRSTEDIVMIMLQYKAIEDSINILTDKQSKRIKQHYFDDLTIRQIAELEKCHFTTVEKSINVGIEKMKKYLINF